MPTIIGFSGKKQAGKGSACKFLIDNHQALFGRNARARIHVFPMAGPLKRLCVEILGLSPEQVYGTDEQKNTLTRYRWEDLPHYESLRIREGVLPTGRMTARQVLQEAGTGIFRTMNDNVWVEAWQREVLASDVDVALCDDIRFPNEVEGVKAIGGGVYRLTRDVYTSRDQHASEHALDHDNYSWANFTGVIDNASLSARETNRLLLLRLYRDGFIPNAIKLCECCEGVSPDDLDYGVAA